MKKENGFILLEVLFAYALVLLILSASLLAIRPLLKNLHNKALFQNNRRCQNALIGSYAKVTRCGAHLIIKDYQHE